MIVAKDGSGDFTTIQEAVNAIPENAQGWTVIQIKNGEYKEKLEILKPRVKLVGESVEGTVLTFDDYAKKTFPDGREYGTFNSQSFLIGADDFEAENLTIANTAGSGDKVGQAVAVYADGDRLVFRNCRFTASQDTLFTAPLPPKPVERATFGGPRDAAPRRNLRQLYDRCYIAGDVDFIFGCATAVFTDCEIFSKKRLVPEGGEKTIHGYITAASTDEDVPYGYVFSNCRLTGDAPEHTVYLGRPWRDYGHTVFLNCWMGAHIKPEGWHYWKPEREETARYEEFGSTGPGAGKRESRVPWAKILTEEEAGKYDLNRVLSGQDGWSPLKEEKAQ